MSDTKRRTPIRPGQHPAPAHLPRNQDELDRYADDLLESLLSDRPRQPEEPRRRP